MIVSIKLENPLVSSRPLVGDYYREFRALSRLEIIKKLNLDQDQQDILEYLRLDSNQTDTEGKKVKRTIFESYISRLMVKKNTGKKLRARIAFESILKNLDSSCKENPYLVILNAIISSSSTYDCISIRYGSVYLLKKTYISPRRRPIDVLVQFSRNNRKIKPSSNLVLRNSQELYWIWTQDLKSNLLQKKKEIEKRVHNSNL